jgi:hypothetical protein
VACGVFLSLNRLELHAQVVLRLCEKPIAGDLLYLAFVSRPLLRHAETTGDVQLFPVSDQRIVCFAAAVPCILSPAPRHKYSNYIEDVPPISTLLSVLVRPLCANHFNKKYIGGEPHEPSL